MKEIVKVSLENEMDLILAHRRAMKLAELTGNSLSTQTIFATAVSEIARCAIGNGPGARLSLKIDSSNGNKKQICAIISDSHDFCKEGSIALRYAKRLIEDVQLRKAKGTFSVCLNQRINFPGTVTDSKIDGFIRYFENEPPISAYDELRRKNLQLQELAEKLRESENDYRQLTDNLPLMMFAVNLDGAITYTNKWLKDFLGITSSSMKVKTWQQFLHPGDYKKLLDQWENAQQTQTPFELQGRLQNKLSQVYIWHLISFVPVKNDKDALTRWIGFFVDIHAQKLVEETLRDNVELKIAQKELERSNKELTSFSYIASHDLQEPLRKIQTFSQRIVDIGEFNATTKDYFNRIVASAERMQSLLDSLLSFSRVNIENTIFKIADLDEFLAEAIMSLKEIIDEKKAIIQTGKLPSLNVIPIQFTQLFINLLSNSLKYAKDGVPPVIKINAEEVNGRDINTHDARPDLKYYKISISDNGIGFEQKYEARIFELFQRLHGKTEYSGTGAGLAICKKIIQNHNGFITAHGEPEIGSTFNIFIPINKISAAG